jgi:hypothetical protein
LESLASFVRQKARVTELVFVEGLDIPLGDPAFGRVLERMHSGDCLRGLPLSVVHTGLRETLDACFRSAELGRWGVHRGAALAAVALALSPRTAIVGSTSSYSLFHP